MIGGIILYHPLNIINTNVSKNIIEKWKLGAKGKIIS